MLLWKHGDVHKNSSNNNNNRGVQTPAQKRKDGWTMSEHALVLCRSHQCNTLTVYHITCLDFYPFADVAMTRRKENQCFSLFSSSSLLSKKNQELFE